jgi:hypothetical protein
MTTTTTTTTNTLTPALLRQFGPLTGAIVAVLFGLLLPWLFDRGLPWWPWVIAAPLVLLALVAPRGLAPVYRGWMAFGAVLGWINTRLILGLVFYLLLLPIGLVMRLLGHDPLRRRREDRVTTYRVPSAAPPPSHFERPF